MDFSKEIEKAALTNYAYDAQSEGNRANYVARLIDISDKKDKLVNGVLKALASERQDTWALDQLFALAGIFANQGNEVARKVIYDKYRKDVLEGSEWLGEEEIVKLDGIDGLRFIAERRGKALIKDPDDWEQCYTFEYCQKQHPKINIYRELNKAAKSNKYIKKYLEAVLEDKKTISKKTKFPKLTYKIIKENIKSKKTFYFTKHVPTDLSRSDILKLADEFLQESDPIKKESYLRFFAINKFPYDPEPILQISMAKNSHNSRLVEFACKSLQYIQDKRIRQFAIQKLSRTNKPADYLHLLVANYKKGDYKLLAKIATKYKDEYVIHGLVWGYIDIYKANKTKECKEPLEMIYSKLTCGPCRHDIVKILYESDALSDRIQREIEFDSYDETRKLFKKIGKTAANIG